MNLKKMPDSPLLRAMLTLVFVLSVCVHLLILTGIYLPGFHVSILLTAGMILAWMYASKRVKEIQPYYKNLNPWKVVFTEGPDWYKFGMGFLILYALINLFMSLSIESSGGYFNTTIPRHKLRGLSGFWIMFFALASLTHVSVNKLIDSAKAKGV